MKKFLTQTRELELLNQGYDFIIGIDEVGRGCWAGPLYMCAYVISKDSGFFEGVNDSKKLSRQTREELYSKLSREPHFLKIIDNKEIDEKGLGKAINFGLKSLIYEVSSQLEGKLLFIVDGYFKGQWDCEVRFESKADGNYYSVASASIIAKVMRDNLMSDLAKSYPAYLFDSNVGYGTAAHIEAINKHGICDIHRKSYKPIKQFLVQI